MSFVLKKETTFTRKVPLVIPDGDGATTGELTITFKLLNREAAKKATGENGIGLMRSAVKEIKGMVDEKGKELTTAKALDAISEWPMLEVQIIQFYSNEQLVAVAKN